jgi:NAD(P)-dependent dehydrogenase (short-subunit alcohol dehydrogenase family)
MSDKKLDGKVALISGGSRGLGRAMAVALAGAGSKIVLVARDLEKLNEVAGMVRQAGSDARVFQADVADEQNVQRLVRDVLSAYGKLNILINNAGINIRKPLDEFTLGEWRDVIDTNLTSVFLMCRAFIPHMKSHGYGRIINMTSIMGRVSLPGRAAYSASKSGLMGLTRALALELAAENITVNGISPGPFATEMNTALMQNPETNHMFVSRTPVGRWGRAEEIGQLALYLCSEDAGYITGTDILIDGGWCAQ